MKLEIKKSLELGLPTPLRLLVIVIIHGEADVRLWVLGNCQVTIGTLGAADTGACGGDWGGFLASV
jgi:hypothetical protein